MGCKRKDRIYRYLLSLKDLRAIVFGITVLHLVVTQIWVARWYQKFGHGSVDVYPTFFLKVPVLLLFASIALLGRRWWTHLVALGVSGWVLYSLGYTRLSAIASAHSFPVFSSPSLRSWFVQKYVGQPQEFLEFGLAFLIISCASFFLVRSLLGSHRYRH